MLTAGGHLHHNRFIHLVTYDVACQNSSFSHIYLPALGEPCFAKQRLDPGDFFLNNSNFPVICHLLGAQTETKPEQFLPGTLEFPLEVGLIHFAKLADMHCY